MEKQPLRVALTGGIASGKSTVAELFAGLGAAILDADLAAREVVAPGSPCLRMLREFLCDGFFEPDGELKRKELRDLIVRDEVCRLRVNAVMHPAIMEILERRWREGIGKEPSRPVIFDIPLLFEIQMADRFDAVILVYAPAHIQLERLMARDGVSRPEAERTLRMQMDIEAKKALSHIIIDNSLDLDATRRQVERAWETLRAHGSLLQKSFNVIQAKAGS